MIIVTGGAGFIGSNLIRKLNSLGINDILLVESLEDGRKVRNIANLNIVDYMDKSEFIQACSSTWDLSDVERVFHLGACVDTMEWDGKYMMESNFGYSKKLALFCLQERVPLVYASSGAVYGRQSSFIETPQYENPLNIYGYSKLLFDCFVRYHAKNPDSLIVGLRYFNVYGRGEEFKGSMASVIPHFNRQIIETGKIKLFDGSHGFAPGLQSRDFISVGDVVDVTLWFSEQTKAKTGIYNCGTGRSVTFQSVAETIRNWHGVDGAIEYIPFPSELERSYQPYTCADLNKLRLSGYDREFQDVLKGVEEYLTWLNS